MGGWCVCVCVRNNRDVKAVLEGSTWINDFPRNTPHRIVENRSPCNMSPGRFPANTGFGNTL